MYKVERSQFSYVQRFLSNFSHHTVLQTIIDGSTPGHGYLNDLDNPTFAFMQYKYRAFISGETSSAHQVPWLRFITEEVFTNCRQANVPLVILTPDSTDWLMLLTNYLKSLNPVIEEYQIYEYIIHEPTEIPNKPKNFEICEVNEDLLKNQFVGKQDLLEEICSERSSVDEFLKYSFGVVAFYNTNLAGWCLSEYNHKNRCEVGIATLPGFRQQGLAKAMTFTFLDIAYGKE